MQLFLASTSPRRKKILREHRIDFKVISPSYEEDNDLSKNPLRLVRIHAYKKALSCVYRVKEGVILSADTIVYHKQKILGKPLSMNQARKMLSSLQGQKHIVYTAMTILVIKEGKISKKVNFSDKSTVEIKPMTSKVVDTYLKRIHPLDKAGAYAVQSRPSIIKAIKGSYYNVMGLPVEKLLIKLKRLGRM